MIDWLRTCLLARVLLHVRGRFAETRADLALLRARDAVLSYAASKGQATNLFASIGTPE